MDCNLDWTKQDKKERKKKVLESHKLIVGIFKYRL